jgi:hypothetical protein
VNSVNAFAGALGLKLSQRAAKINFIEAIGMASKLNQGFAGFPFFARHAYPG